MGQVDDNGNLTAYSYDALAGLLLEIYREAIAERRIQNEPLGHTLTEVASN